MEVRVGQRGECPHPTPLPQSGRGKLFLVKLRVISSLKLVVVTVAIFATVLSGCGKKAAPLSESEVKAVVEKTLPSTAEDKSLGARAAAFGEAAAAGHGGTKAIAGVYRLCPRPGDYGRTKIGFSSELEGRNGG